MGQLDRSAYGVFAIVIALGFMLVSATARASKTLNEPSFASQRALVGTALFLLVWLGVTGAVSKLAFMRAYDALPPPMFRIFVPTLICVTWLVLFSSAGDRLVRGLSFARLVALQAFRFPLELLLIYGFYAEGKAPIQMTVRGQNLDIVTGTSAIALALWLWGRRERPTPRTLILVWNVVGTALLLNIVMLSVLSMPGPLRMFQNEPANTFVFEWPYIWVPTFFVIFAAAGHVLVFRKLASERGLNPGSSRAREAPS